ncbi:lactosylceramide 4-alpha-galactosyltransferase [Ranunculus cassubicifolius]
MLRPRWRPRYGAQVCAIIAALLLFVSILHSRLKFNPQSHPQFNPNNIIEFTQDSTDDLDALVANPLIEDVVDQLTTTNSNLVGNDDRIDELDDVVFGGEGCGGGGREGRDRNQSYYCGKYFLIC